MIGPAPVITSDLIPVTWGGREP